jgi:hypothetical protein
MSVEQLDCFGAYAPRNDGTGGDGTESRHCEECNGEAIQKPLNFFPRGA